ncbi:metal/formaldehyde-sensitive transcriptional repressor [Chromobacterium subtsugae]|uniref:Metal/formaldehyde-sensitive transcriptional repressor n=1 Tax=Chromobacterium subtsugae TaxID=251747 RepID=A0ABS7FEG4_9NEIS|nr:MULTISPECIES: metal/formaldehyde-sensitive transcriptional repressor [Chromobacterium]KUM04852.1 transcriptional repressor rcnR [Chromobacterium subtsugae]KZE87746.1 transcriptional repressor rcnR [Chromobacterium sp. F49]MBW7568247.1 metal/formaldehyde-sensitive transcriptional repressor [Chromobacterium subtsugae]MBW8288447.1 metal/formaldehyde-sensitive transcriptional repressor [Chromobacterium subtsugae]WSE89943.1 metal/formaldehyde-sensitive transcriptional repressor [Chromobacterium 
MAHTIRNKAKLLARVRRIQGQAAALEKRLDAGDEDCGAVLQQIAAIRGAVNGLMAAVIEGHLSEHLVNEPEQAQRQRDLDAVLQVLKSYLK